MPFASSQSYPPARRRLRVGIVGGGGGGLVGHWHWTGIRVSNRWELVAGALSSDPDKARASGREWMLADDRIYTDYREMAAAEAARDDGIEAVAICTPNHTHFDIAMTFMDAGIDIICDKPMVNGLDEVAALDAKRRETGLVFAITHPYVYHPMVRQARDMIAEGAIGEINQALVEYAQDWATQGDDPDAKKNAWRRDPSKIGRASATGDIGTHAFQMIEHVTGRTVSRLRADFHLCGGAKAMEDTAFLKLEFDNGAPGSLWVTQAAPGNYCALTFRVFGSEGGLSWNQEFPETLRYTPYNAPEQTIVRGHGNGVLPGAARMTQLPRGHPESLSDAWGNLYAEIAIAIEARRDGKEVPENMLAIPDFNEGARGVQFIHAAADSHEAGGVWTAMD